MLGYRITPYRELKRPSSMTVKRSSSLRIRKYKDENQNMSSSKNKFCVLISLYQSIFLKLTSSSLILVIGHTSSTPNNKVTSSFIIIEMTNVY